MGRQAKESNLFWGSFWTNRAAAVGQFLVPAVAVGTHLPPESWGILAPSAADLYLTYKFGKEVIRAVNSSSVEPEALPIDASPLPQEA
jgi:hypothetical protein